MKPWYREGWPWALMLPPLLAVAGGVMMLVLAIGTPATLVVADYAHIDELTSVRFARDHEAARLGISASVQFSDDQVELLLTGASPVPPELVLYLQHATDVARDRELRLLPDGAGFAATAAIEPGRYRLELLPADKSWRLASSLVNPVGQVSLRPQDAGG